MAEFQELIKNFDRIRDYMRQFYIYGFKVRNDFDSRSARTYDKDTRTYTDTTKPIDQAWKVAMDFEEQYTVSFVDQKDRELDTIPAVNGTTIPEEKFTEMQAMLWSSFFVTLVAKKIVLINLCCRPCFIWGSITIITVWTNMIIINVCKFFYLLIECFLCCKLIQICAFILQGIEITLHRCIVVRISCFAHALCHIYRFAEFGKCFGRIL